MSHLPLDARTILEYLNELGYRNITAAQLKEFLKGMQPQSEVPSTTTKPSTASTRNCVTPNPKTTANNKNLNLKSPSICKLVKGKKPLINFKFYLDIKDHQISKKVEERITELGGTLEFFLTKSVTHFITDRSPPDRRPKNQQNNSTNRNGYCANSPVTAGGASGGGVGGGGGCLGYPVTQSPYIQSPQTPATPQTPYTSHTHSGGDSATDGAASSQSRLGGVVGVATTPNHKKKISRADAMLHRALQSQQQTQSANQTSTSRAEEEDNRPHLEPGAYAIWDLDYAIRFLKKVTADLKQFAKKPQQPNKGAWEPTQLKGHFIKIESINQNSRPYYSVFRNIEWPKVQLKEDGAFRLTPKEDELKSAKEKPSKTNAMTRKSRSSSKHNHNHMRLKAKQAPKQAEKPAVVDNSSEKQCGVCEICKIEYDTLTIHLKTKDHEFFARNQNNYLALDSLIKSSASVDKFLHENEKVDPKQESDEPMDLDEEVTRQTRQSSRIQTPPPPLKIKTKLKDVESQGSGHDKKPPTQNNMRKPVKSSAQLDSPPIRHPLPNSTLYKVVEDSKSGTEPATPQTPSIIVKFRKVRQTELSILNGEAENFMFPKRPASSECATDSDRQTSTDSNRISSSSISSESHSLDDHHVAAAAATTAATTTTGVERVDSAASKRRRIVAGSSRKSTTTTTVTSVCYQSFQNAPIQPDRTSRVTREVCDRSRNSVTPKPTTQRRQRSTGGGRKRCGTSRSRRQRQRRRQRCASEDGMGDEETDRDIEDDEEERRQGTNLKHEDPDDSKESIQSPKAIGKKKVDMPAIDINQGRIGKQKYSFERLPIRELWFEVFHRQDACHERLFEYWGSTSYRKLPYEMGPMPIRATSCCKLCTPVPPVEVKQEPKGKTSATRTGAAPTKLSGKLKKIKKETPDGGRQSKNSTPDPEKAGKSHPRIRNNHLNKATFLSYDLMPRKSPREHASTLAILSCLIKQRQNSEVDETLPRQSPTPKEKEKTPEKIPIAPKRKTSSPVVRIDTPEPLQFVSEISENVKRLRRGQRKFDDFIPSQGVNTASVRKPRKPKTGLEFELDEKRLKSLDVKHKTSVQLEHEIDTYLNRIAVKSLRLTPSPPPTESSGFIDDFSSDVNLIDLIDCYDGGGEGGGEGEEDNSIDQPVHRPASCNVFSFFSAHNPRRKNNKINKTGWPKKRRNVAATRQSHLLQKPERFRLFCDYQTRQKNRLIDSRGLVSASMTPPDTDVDEKYDFRRREVATLTPVPGDGAILCKGDILNNGYMSPSEKADNSDIFTVSSDGLDTDLDVSSQIKTEDIDDECTTSSTLAAPPATPEPAAKLNSISRTTTPLNKLTTAITSIMKKEVKVSCKRLRTPFRRFRQRR